LFALVIYPASHGFAEKVTEWKTGYNKTIKLLPELQKQSSLTDVSIRCKSMLNMFNGAMTDADKIILSKIPDKAKAQNVLSKLKQVKIELERVLAEFSQAERGAEAEIERKRGETAESIADNAIDEAKSSYEAEKELFKQAIKIMREYLELYTQTIQTLIS